MPSVLLAAVLLTACGGADPAVTVFAAASTGPAVDEAVDAWSGQTGHEVQTSAAASSVLVRQVQAGAGAGVVLLAHPAWADRLQAAGGYAERVDLLANRLVVIAAPGAPPPTLDAVLGGGRGCLAIADPAHVPAGMYAREALASLGAWEALEGRVVPALDAPAAVALVARGECPAGIAYATDAGPAGVVVGEPVPTAHHEPIRYPALRADDASEPARALYGWLQGAEARAVFEAHGFGTP